MTNTLYVLYLTSLNSPEAMATIFEQIWARKFAFLATFFLVFVVMYSILFVLDFLPEAPADTTGVAVDELQSVVDTPVATATSLTTQADVLAAASEAAPSAQNATTNSAVAGVYVPTSISIPKLNKTVSVSNPESRAVEDLDAALLSGTVRHPDSALLNQNGTVLIFGHSSYLPNVINKNFQAFNGIQNLEWGDTIEVSSGERTFVYRVDKVYRAKASGITVPIAGDKQKLTLSTCNSFGTTDDRYIVEAYLVD